MSIMTPSIISFIFFLLHLSSSTTPHHHHDIIAVTCETCTLADPKLNYSLCLSSLSSVPKSHHSDLRGLALISTRLALTNASTIASKVKRILKQNTSSEERASPYLKSCLETCLELYSDSVDTLKHSAKAIRASKYEEANIMLSSVVDAPETCEDSFGDGGLKSPLTKENNDFFDRTVIALDITALLINKR